MFKRAQKKEMGQALVEMAITAPILILILSGLLDLGRVYYTFIALEEAAAEAALYLAIEPDCPIDDDPLVTGDCDDPNNALYRGSTAGNQEFDAALVEWNIPADSTNVHGWPNTAANFVDPFDECGGSKGIGCIVKIQLRYPFDFITPGMENMANAVTGGNGLWLSVQATQIIVFE